MTTPPHTSPGPPHGPASDDGAAWDERYASAERVWSGQPNGVLAQEAAASAPGRALDVGCGEGADAVWLARRGWDVTALDPSRVALDRARAAAEAAGVHVRWVQAGLLQAGIGAGSFDLVSAQYPALRRTPGQEAERALLAGVATGGTLLAVFHADMDPEHAKERGFDPEDYVGRDQVIAALGDGWSVEIDERRARHVDGGAGAQHLVDLVVRARRTS